MISFGPLFIGTCTAPRPKQFYVTPFPSLVRTKMFENFRMLSIYRTKIICYMFDFKIGGFYLLQFPWVSPHLSLKLVEAHWHMQSALLHCAGALLLTFKFLPLFLHSTSDTSMIKYRSVDQNKNKLHFVILMSVVANYIN